MRTAERVSAGEREEASMVTSAPSFSEFEGEEGARVVVVAAVVVVVVVASSSSSVTDLILRSSLEASVVPSYTRAKMPRPYHN